LTVRPAPAGDHRFPAHGLTIMRRLVVTLLVSAIAVASGLAADAPAHAATAEEIALLKEAMTKSNQDTEHWAYTETTIIRDKKGKKHEETIVRFDPSKPYAERYTPLKIDGKEPTERQIKKYRKEGEKRGQKLRREAEAQAKRNPDEPPQLSVNDDTAALDLEHPLVVADEAGRITFEIPLRAEKDSDIPVEKFEIRMQVNKATRQAEHAWLRIKESFRMALVAKIKKGEVTIDFAVVDPNFGPVMTSLEGDFGVSLLFIPFNAVVSNTRTEWQRVKPYDERFSVKLAPLQLLGF
jgi:hypothetical protein